MANEFLAQRFMQDYRRGGLLQKIFGCQRDIEESIGDFLGAPNMTSFICAVSYDENESRYVLQSCQGVAKVADIAAVDDSAYLLQVLNDSFELETSWILKDKEGVPFALAILAKCEIRNAHDFLHANLRRFQAYDSVAPINLEQRLQPEALALLAPMFAKYTYALISGQAAVSPEWIATQLTQCLQPYGVVVNVVEPKYDSDTVNAKREEETLAAARQQEEDALREALEHDHNMRTIRSDYEQSEQRRKHQETLDACNRQMEEEAARDEIRRRRILAKQERDKLKSQRKFDRLEAELRLSELRQKPRAYREELQAELDAARAERDRANQAFQELQEQVQQLTANLPEIVRRLAERPAAANDAAQPAEHNSTLNDTVALARVMGVDAQTLEQEGETNSKLFVSAALAQRAQSKTLPTIATRFASLVSRDICPGVTGNSVHVGKPITFDFVSPIAGYLTIVNLGTSGRYYLHSPNYYVAPGNAKVPANTKCDIPGKLLSPNGQISAEDYNELGPVGWEEVYVIVTPQPLTKPEELQQLSDKWPCAELSLGRMLEMIEALGELPADQCAVGAVSFFVVND